MNNELIIFDEILYKNLAPWLPKNNPDEIFHDLIQEVKAIQPEFQYLYEIDFFRPFNKKTKYYYKLILNECINYTNNNINLINEDKNSKLKKYWINDTLNKKLTTRLKDIGKLIQEKDFKIEFINPKNAPYNIDTNHKTNTYIIQLLKTTLIKVYLEIQETFKSNIKNDDIMIEEDFYTQLLLEPIPTKSFLKLIPPTVELMDDSDKSQPPPKKEEFSLYESFKYIHFDTDPDNLTDLFNSLINKKLIHSETTLPNFKRIFSGQPITNPIIWTGNISELNYFIKLIHNTNKSVDYLKQHHWEVAVRCFVDNSENEFDRKQLKEQKKPKATAHLIEGAASHL